MTSFRHPYQNLGTQALRFWSALTGAAFVLATAIFAIAVPTPHLVAVASFVQSAPPAAQALLDQWDGALRLSFSFMLGFDFLYDLLHNNFVAFLAFWGARRVEVAWALRLAALISWVLWLDSALNVTENLVYICVLATNEVVPWHLYGSIVFQFRTLTLVAGAVVACSFHLWAFTRDRAA